MNHLKVSEEKLSIEQIFDLTKSNSSGAVHMFIGTRDIFEEYSSANSQCEAFTALDLDLLKNVCDEIRSFYPHIDNIVVYCRTGPLSITETKIIVAVSCKQTEEAIKATERIIDKLKKIISTWNIENPLEIGSVLKRNRKINQVIETPYVPAHLVQIKTTNNEIKERIRRFMQRKRSELDVNNIREFCCGDRNSEFTCARVDAILHKRKDSKSHLQVHRVLNSYQQRDQKNSNYLTQFIPPNGVEERLENVENQLSLSKPVPKNVFQRLKLIEDRLLQLESISPEYIQFWDKVSLPTSRSAKKRTFCTDEVDDLIAELEKQIKSN